MTMTSVAHDGIDPEVGQKRRLLWTAGIVSSLVMLDSNLVAVSLPSIAASLGASFAAVQWVVTAYVLPFTALLLAAGSFADLRGRRRATMLGLGIFTAASVGCGLAPSILVLNLARAVQGVGAALLLTAGLAVINHAFRGPERARAYAFWGTCIGLAITLGPIVGGLINNLFGWRWAFLVNLPVGLVLLAAVVRKIAESQDPEAQALDLPGVTTLAIGLLGLTFALIEGNALGWTHGVVLSALVLSLVAFVAFGLVEMRQPRPMLDLRLLGLPAFQSAAAAMVGYAAGAQVFVFFLPSLLQVGIRLDPAAAGLAMLPFAVPMFLAPRLVRPWVGRIADAHLLAGALTVTAVADLALAATAPGGYPGLAAAMVLAGAAAGVLNSETARVIQGTVPPERGGMASGISATVRFTALLIGIAGFGAIFGGVVVDRFAAWATGVSVDADSAMAAARRLAAGDLPDALRTLPARMRGAATGAARQAVAEEFRCSATAAALVAALAALLTWRLARKRHGRTSVAPGDLHRGE